MSQSTHVVPEETSLICEGCGYLLDGLPAGGNCPECGMPMERSVLGRTPPPWEAERGAGVSRLSLFIHTTFAVIFQPKRFFRSLATRSDAAPARRFAMIHWAMASVLFGWAAQLHADWYLELTTWRWNLGLIGALAMACAAFGSFWLTTRLATALTAWEARYRGYRLPVNVVRRGLYYHAAHYLPVAMVTLATVGGFVMLNRTYPRSLLWGTGYLYVLCGEVIVAAGYLFNTYWISMRNMMYANR